MTSTSPKVSIIVNCYNQGHCIKRSVDSVLKQTFTNLECVIVDDGSTDDTALIAEKLMAVDPRVRYCPKENCGLPAARNYGVQQARGEWIQLLDGDDWIAPQKTEFQLNWLSQHQLSSHQAVLYSDYQRVYLNADESIDQRQDFEVGFLTSEQFIQRLLLPDFLTQTPHPALQQAMLMHRSVLERHSFPEHLKALGDRFFAVDILAQGAQFIYTPLIGAFYTKHRQNRTNNWSYMRDYYIRFYETVRSRYPEHIALCHDGLSFLMDEAIRERNVDNFRRLREITTYPLHVLNGNLKIDSPWLLQLFCNISQRLPKFLLYPQYRGPRSKKLFALLSR